MVFGSKGTDVILSVEHFCCDRPNPILQVSLFFVLIDLNVIYLMSRGGIRSSRMIESLEASIH